MAQVEQKECVALLHGLGRSARSFIVLERVLRRQGYDVVNLTYPSTRHRISDLAESHLPQLLARCSGSKLHFVTHSLGGILLRFWLQNNSIDNLGRTVMLAPPNGGSELVDALSDLPPFEWITGPAGPQLSTADDAVPARLGPANFEVGIIAGNQKISLTFGAFLPGDNDGTVSIPSTRLEGMKDHIILPVGHSFLMNNPVVMCQVLTFLRSGAFDRELTFKRALGNLLNRKTE